MKSLMLLYREVLAEAGTRCSVSTDRDLKTITVRAEHEGLSFLTITLPKFGKAFEKALDRGYISNDLFPQFHGRGGLPDFLRGFLSLVFDSRSGRLLDEPDHEAILCVRQLTLMFGKIKLECTPERVRAAVDKYVECEQDLKSLDTTSINYESFRRTGAMLFGDVFSYVEAQLRNGEVLPKHGNGQTADRVMGNPKYDQRYWTARLERVFPFGRFAFPNWRSYHEALEEGRVQILEPGSEVAARVTTVPKTMSTPRIIAMEPVPVQYMQQALLRSMVEGIGRSKIASWLIRFNDQKPNQRLALEGSLTRSLATLDLSEASDRVHIRHVSELLKPWPLLREAVLATRSTKADVPGHGVLTLTKFASMGSALCFPFEAVVFSTILFEGLQQELNRPLTRHDLRAMRGRVRVYGDDIVVPSTSAETCVRWLEAFGLKVNRDKSFWTGWFRESCGKEYYAGTDVSIVRVRQLLPTHRQDNAEEIISTVSLRNQLYRAGWWRTVRFLDELLERVIPFPAVSEDSNALGKHSFLGYDTERLCPRLHRPMVKACVVHARLPESPLEGWPALMKFFLKAGDLPVADEEHLRYSGRPVSVNIKTRWAYSSK